MNEAVVVSVTNGVGSNEVAPDRSEFWKDDFVPLQSASNAVLGVMRDDETCSHGDLYRRILTSVSSSDAESIPNHCYFPGGAMDTTIHHAHSMPLPPLLQAELRKSKAATMMGLFPEAQLAWMTMDSHLYLWSYTRSVDGAFLHFQVPSHQPIVSVGLAPPKAGVFVQSVEWCLAVTTKEEAMLCALARQKEQAWTIIPTRMVIPSDFISFLSVTSTQDGRIFFGGQDGNIYELDYELLAAQQSYLSASKHQSGGALLLGSTKHQLDNFYDGPSGICPPVIVEPSSSAKTTSLLAESGKRVLSTIMSSSSSTKPRTKCRKLNHLQSPMSMFVPDLLSKAASAIFGDSTTTGGGPIVQMVVDHERKVLYALSSRGWICSLDIADAPKITLASVLNTPSTARHYLDAVSRGRMYPPSVTNARDGHLRFPGGAEAAKAGVGGMEGARSILKLAEAAKSDRRRSQLDSVLTPVSIHVVPTRESTRLTLLAITAGGLRYYLSSLRPNILSAGPATPPFGTPRYRHPWKPHSRFTLCHIRAPPSMTTASGSITSGQLPAIPKDLRVDATCYRSGGMFAALQQTSRTTGDAGGNVLVAALPDSMARIKKVSDKDGIRSVDLITPGGICEVVSFPMAMDGSSTQTAYTLPGGRVWDISPASVTDDNVLLMTLRSKTPTDGQLGYSMVPPYVPESKRTTTSSSSSVPSGRQLVAASRSSMPSRAVSVITNLLWSRPVSYGIDTQLPLVPRDERQTLYRVSGRSASSTNGYSLSAADVKVSGKQPSARSARLSPWLLSPDVTPLNPCALQHLETDDSQQSYLALNAGGVHSFSAQTTLRKLASAILTAGTNVRTDPVVTTFFEQCGFAEGCAMCLVIATKPSSSQELKEYALRAALARAYRPVLQKLPSDESVASQPKKNDSWIPVGYSFTPSALKQGLTMTLSRFLRPIWYKPAVVVTEGRVLKRGSKSVTTPAKVELLLEDGALERIREPLFALQQVMARAFGTAVNSVPLSKSPGSVDDMNIDGHEDAFVTRNLQYQQRGRLQYMADYTLRQSDAEELAQHIEERNIHCLYRLLSRTVQLLSLLSELRRAHAMPDLPEVEWGLLHGISVSELVTAREGQERIEALMNKLVTSSTKRTGDSRYTPTADAHQIATFFSEQCYHFFSRGSHFAFNGFQAAQMALALPADHTRRRAYASEALKALTQAAKNWYSAPLITGRLLHSRDPEGYEEVAIRAMQFDSPLAKACELLVNLGDVVAVVDICLETASNFNSQLKSSPLDLSKRSPSMIYQWEMGLYHKRHDLFDPSNASSASSASPPLGTTVTAKDAVGTCHALIFYHVTRLLDSPNGSEARGLGVAMVSKCASASDKLFLNAFFDHLLKRNFKSVLLRISSPQLEKWLAESQKDKPELLLQFYQMQDRNMEAAQVAWNRAIDQSIDLDLNDRVECLVQAEDAFARAAMMQQGDSMELARKTSQVQDALKIARLQGRILQTVGATKYDVSDEDVQQLRTKLLKANDLFNRIAMPCDMFENCLLLMHACQHGDETYLKQFWKSVFCEEVFPCSTRSEQAYRLLRKFAEGSLLENPMVTLLDSSATSNSELFESGSWMQRIEVRVQGLGKEMYGTDAAFVFPVTFIMGCLEDLRRAFSVSVSENDALVNQGWPSRVLVNAGVEYMTALRAYAEVMEQEGHASMGGVDPSWRLEHLQNAITILETFEEAARPGLFDTPNSACEEMTRELASGRLLSGIEVLRSQLQALPSDVSNEESRLDAVVSGMKRFYST